MLVRSLLTYFTFPGKIANRALLNSRFHFISKVKAVVNTASSVVMNAEAVVTNAHNNIIKLEAVVHTA